MKTKSKKLIALLLSAAALAAGVALVLTPQTVLAQQGPRGESDGDHGCHERGGDGARPERSPAERLAHWQELLARVSARLQLNARQATEAQRILQDTAARAAALHASTVERTPERRAGREAMMQQADARFTALLTAEQRTAWLALKVELRERRGHGGGRGHHGGPGHGGGHGWGEGAGPGQRTEADRGI